MSVPEFTFLSDALAEAPCRVAVFGKHPCAADHLEDIGLSTRSLTFFKQRFYVDAIGECLSRQSWARDVESISTIPYDHNFISLGPAGWLVGSLAASSDATGRKQFPIVFAVHVGSLASLSWLPELGPMAGVGIETVRGSSLSRNDLIQAQGLAETKFRQVLFLRPGGSSGGDQDIKQQWVSQQTSMNGGAAYHRAFHLLHTDGAGSERARLPLNGANDWVGAALWCSLASHFAGYEFGQASMVWRRGSLFGDLALGAPDFRLMASAFASIERVPLSTEIPFSLSEDAIAEADASLQAWLRGTGIVAAPTLEEVKVPPMLNRVCKRLGKWLK